MTMDRLDDKLHEKELKNNRLSEYKKHSRINDQESRRLQLLIDQKRKREDYCNSLRKVTEFFPEDVTDNFAEPYQETELMEWTGTKPEFPQMKDLIMLSEWMVSIPENLEEKWSLVFCPVGKRCLVKSAKGCTTTYTKNGHQVARFQSALPNGSQRDFAGTRFSNSEITILDCIWSSETKTYFILDLLSWKGQSYMDTEASFRDFWIKSRIEEIPWLSEKSSKNPFSFIPLEHHICDSTTISSIMARYPYFPQDTPKIDGLLFYHSEAYYTSGYTPLVVWLKPFMVPEMFGIMLSDAWMQMKPSSYIDMNDFIVNYEKKKREKEKRPRKKKNKKAGNPMDEDIEEAIEVEMFDKAVG